MEFLYTTENAVQTVLVFIGLVMVMGRTIYLVVADKPANVQSKANK